MQAARLRLPLAEETRSASSKALVCPLWSKKLHRDRGVGASVRPRFFVHLHILYMSLREEPVSTPLPQPSRFHPAGNIQSVDRLRVGKVARNAREQSSSAGAAELWTEKACPRASPFLDNLGIA